MIYHRQKLYLATHYGNKQVSGLPQGVGKKNVFFLKWLKLTPTVFFLE